MGGGGGGAVRPPCGFCPLLKKSLGNPYLKILDFSQLLVADTPMKLFTPSDSIFVTPSTIFFLHFDGKMFRYGLPEDFLSKGQKTTGGGGLQDPGPPNPMPLRVNAISISK